MSSRLASSGTTRVTERNPVFRKRKKKKNKKRKEKREKYVNPYYLESTV